MTRFTSSSGRLVYWGRKVFKTEDELTSYFNNNSSSPIVLYRNQAAITYKIENNVSINFQGLLSVIRTLKVQLPLIIIRMKIIRSILI